MASSKQTQETSQKISKHTTYVTEASTRDTKTTEVNSSTKENGLISKSVMTTTKTSKPEVQSSTNTKTVVTKTETSQPEIKTSTINSDTIQHIEVTSQLPFVNTKKGSRFTLVATSGGTEGTPVTTTRGHPYSTMGLTTILIITLVCIPVVIISVGVVVLIIKKCVTKPQNNTERYGEQNRGFQYETASKGSATSLRNVWME